jgi:hypothetical protein
VIKSEDERGGTCKTNTGEMINVCRILVRKSEEPLQRTNIRFRDNIQTDNIGKWCDDLGWIHLAQDRDE